MNSHAGTTARSLADCYSECERITRATAGNFFYAFWGLPPKQFRAMCVLYAFMRISDDLGDDDSKPLEERSQDLLNWRTNFRDTLRTADSPHPVLRATADVVKQFDIPENYFFDVLDGVKRDLAFTEFATFEELQKYCYQVAGAVGLCCIHIWGFHDGRAIERSIDCGLAFQLTNILRDLSDDADLGRVYLPRDELNRFNYDFDDIQTRTQNENFQQLMRFQVERAKEYYKNANELFDYLKPPGKPILRAMLQIYGGILTRIEQQGYDVYSGRIGVPVWRKVMIGTQSVFQSSWQRLGGAR